MRHINLDQLRALIEVVECRSFSAAARRLNLSQPAVSLQIRELERRFGVPPIERFGKQAHATPPGRELIKAAQRIFDACTSAEEAMRRFRENWVGRVHLSTTLTAMIYRLPPILRKLRGEHPGVDLVVTNMPTPLSVARILSNEADLALVTLPVDNYELRVTPLCQESMLAAFPAGENNVPSEITPEYITRQRLLLLTEQPPSAGHTVVMRWVPVRVRRHDRHRGTRACGPAVTSAPPRMANITGVHPGSSNGQENLCLRSCISVRVPQTRHRLGTCLTPERSADRSARARCRRADGGPPPPWRCPRGRSK